LNQAQRKSKREKEYRITIKKVIKRSGGICEHCKIKKGDDPAHNIPKKTDGYKYFALLENINHWCRDCHILYDQFKVKEFARINVDSFLKLMDYLKLNGQIKRYNNYMDKYNE
jgi:hypothetical protein